MADILVLASKKPYWSISSKKHNIQCHSATHHTERYHGLQRQPRNGGKGIDCRLENSGPFLPVAKIGTSFANDQGKFLLQWKNKKVAFVFNESCIYAQEVAFVCTFDCGRLDTTYFRLHGLGQKSRFSALPSLNWVRALSYLDGVVKLLACKPTVSS